MLGFRKPSGAGPRRLGGAHVGTRKRIQNRLLAVVLAVLLGVLASPGQTANASEPGCSSTGYICTPGYTGANASGTWAWKYYGGSEAATPTGYHNCTLYAAWRLAQNGLPDPGRSWGNAIEWAGSIGGGDHRPAVGAIAWWGASRGGGRGHVAYVEQVNGSQILVRADNYSPTSGTTTAGWIDASSVDQFLHPRDLAPPAPESPVVQFAGQIVTWNGDSKTQKTSWLVMPDLTRVWVPDTSTFNGLKTLGAPGPVALDSNALGQLRDRTGERAYLDQLGVGWIVGRGTMVWSTVNGYALAFQTDGNLVIYAPGGRAIWASFATTAARLAMQADGNLVLYDAANRPVWNTRTDGNSRSRMVMQPDGNLVVYRADGRATWATMTNGATNRLNNPAGFRL